MTLKSKLKIERRDTALLSIFYLISGIAYFLILALDFSNLIVVFLGFLSLLITYGLFKMKRWTVPFVIALFFPQITFNIFTLYPSVTSDTFSSTIEALLFNLGLIAHVILLTFCLLYITAKRKEFQL